MLAAEPESGVRVPLAKILIRPVLAAIPWLLASCATSPSPRPAPAAVTVTKPAAVDQPPPLPACPADEPAATSLADLDPKLKDLECVPAGSDARFDAPVALFSKPAGGALLGTIIDPISVGLWDFQEGSDFAQLVGRRGARVRGFVHSGVFVFHVRDKLWIHAPHVSASAGVPLRILRHDGGRFRVRVATRFERPRFLDAVAQCSQLRIGTPFPTATAEPEPAGRHEPNLDAIVELKNGGATLYDAPNGKQLFEFRYTLEPNYPNEVDRRKGFVRIVAEYRGIEVDAWVRRSEVHYPERIGGGWWVDPPKVRTLALPAGLKGLVRETTPIFVDSPHGRLPVGELPKGSGVTLGSSAET